MNAAPLGSVRGIEAFPQAQVTGATTGSVFYAYYTQGEPPLSSTYSGWFGRAAIFVDQSAGSGNNGGNYLQVTLQGRHDSTDPWATIPQSAEIKITENVATGYYASVSGPLLPELRINITETGVADATFRVHVFMEA